MLSLRSLPFFAVTLLGCSTQVIAFRGPGDATTGTGPSSGSSTGPSGAVTTGLAGSAGAGGEGTGGASGSSGSGGSGGAIASKDLWIAFDADGPASPFGRDIYAMRPD